MSEKNPAGTGAHSATADSQIGQQLTELKARFDASADGQKQALAALEERIKLREEFSALREEVRAKFRFFQWSAGAIGVGLALLASLGLKSANDYISAAKAELTARLDRVANYYYDFSRAVALRNSPITGPADSLPYFRRCFEQEHYDEALLIAYLDALDYAEDWRSATEVIRSLEQHPTRLNGLKAPLVWGNLANLEIQIGVDDPDSLSKGRESLRRFDSLLNAEDEDMLRQRYFLHWMIAMCDRRFDTAREYIEKIATLPPSIKVASWEKMKRSMFIRRLVAKGVSEADLEKMILRLKNRFKSE